jgi:hypothetical protein
MKPISAPRNRPGLRGDHLQRLGRGPEQDVVDHGLVLVRDGRDLGRHGEDDVEVLHGQQLGAPLLQPLLAHQRLALRAVAIPAAVVSDALVAATVAALDMATQRGRAAQLDCTHDTALRAIERAGVIAAEGSAEAAEDIRHLQPGGTQRGGLQK